MLSAADGQVWHDAPSVDALGSLAEHGALGTGGHPSVVVATSTATAEAVVTRWPDTRTVVLAVEEPGRVVERTIGTVVLLDADAQPERLRAAIDGLDVAARRPWQPTSMAPAPLTPRERTVVEGIAAGRNAREIAAAMGVSVRTVEAHKQRVFAKWGVRSQSQAVELALRHDLIDVRSA